MRLSSEGSLQSVVSFSSSSIASGGLRVSLLPAQTTFSASPSTGVGSDFCEPVRAGREGWKVEEGGGPGGGGGGFFREYVEP